MRRISSHPVGAASVLMLILTACGGGGGSTAPSTGPDAVFAPSTNTSLSGTVTYKSVSIPAGVTVTVTGDLNLTVVGDASIGGSLVSQCKPVSVSAGGVLSVSGNVRVDCPDATDSIPLTLVGKGGFDLNGATLSSGGNLAVVNDASLVSTDLGLTAPSEAPERAGGNPDCRIANTTISAQPAKRAKAPDGVTDGGNGNSAYYKELGCRGDLVASGLTMNGQSGAAGGNGTSNTSTPSHGGFGGAAGALLITATGDITLNGAVQLNGGDGGKGGDATSTGQAGSPGVSVTAIAGKGGNVKPKNFDAPIIIQAGGALNVVGGITAVLGHAGDGGVATATAGNGNPGNPGANGGDATATGGNGGDGVPPIFRGTGAVNIQGSIVVSGGAAGNGGNAVPTAGNGGAGNAPGAAGGVGGKQNGRGGDGGKGVSSGSSPAARAPSLAGPPPFASRGGNAGSSAFTGGNGGAGGNNCNPAGAGGAGGKGGDVAGGNGTPGVGNPSGSPGPSSITNAGNGAKGGDGSTPGAGGLAGADGVPNVTPVGSFVAGLPGAVCGGSGAIAIDLFPSSQTTTQGGSGSVQVTVTRSGGFTGEVSVTVKDDQGNTLGSGTVPSSATQTEVGFSIPSNFATGSHTFSVTASGAGVAPVTKTFGVTVNPPSSGSTFQVASCDPAHPLVSAGNNTGSGWVPGANANGTWTLSTGLGTKFSFYATQQTALGYKTFVGYATPSEAPNIPPILCDWTRPIGMVTLPFANLPSGDSYNALLGGSFASAQSPATQAVFNNAVLGTQQFLVGAVVSPTNGIMQFAPYGRVTPTDNMVLPTLDLGSNMIMPVMKTYSVGNGGTDILSLNLLYGDLNGRFENTIFGALYSGPSQLFDVVPASGLPSDAIQAIKFTAVNQTNGSTRSVKAYFRTPADGTWTLGSDFGPVGYSEPNTSCRAGDFAFAINPQYNSAIDFLLFQGNRQIFGYATKGYLGTAATAILKTSDIPNVCSYAPQTGQSINWQFGGFGSTAQLFAPHAAGDLWYEAFRVGQQP